MSELEYNTPLFFNDKEYVQCSVCEGDGWLWTSADEVNKKECPNCLGTGIVEIEK